MKDLYDIGIVGAGLIGLTTAFSLIKKYPNQKICVLDKEAHEAFHQSGHNSGVIHSGIYYAPGSLKAKNCIKGYNDLIQFCDKYGVNYDICGKIIVATKEEELGALDQILAKGLKNGLTGLDILDKEGVKEHEPYVEAIKGIWVPQAGIIHYPDVALKLREILSKKGVEFRFDTKVLNIIEKGNEINIETSKGTLSAQKLITCAGLYADKLCAMSGLYLEEKIVPFRGEYYKLKKDKTYLVNNLIYPVPNPNFPFLGVHYTRMQRGGIEAGPNAVLAFKREGYSRWDINIKELSESLSYPGFLKLAKKHWKDGVGEMHRSFSKKAFVDALRHLIPDVTVDDFERSGAGVRAQALDKQGRMVEDFLIKRKGNTIHVVNAPSPAATSCLAIGAYIVDEYLGDLGRGAES